MTCWLKLRAARASVCWRMESMQRTMRGARDARAQLGSGTHSQTVRCDFKSIFSAYCLARHARLARLAPRPTLPLPLPLPLLPSPSPTPSPTPSPSPPSLANPAAPSLSPSLPLALALALSVSVSVSPLPLHLDLMKRHLVRSDEDAGAYMLRPRGAVAPRAMREWHSDLARAIAIRQPKWRDALPSLKTLMTAR
jgi:hypothetical protein